MRLAIPMLHRDARYRSRMTSRLPSDPEAGRDFFRRGPLFVCALAPPLPGDRVRSAALAFSPRPGEAIEELPQAIEFAGAAAGRGVALVIERVALGREAWPVEEPLPAGAYIAERDGFVVLAPSVEGRVHMPPAQPHHLVQVVAAFPCGGEADARAALEALATCGLVGKVRAVVLGDSGATVDAVVAGRDGLRAGWFPAAAQPAPPGEARAGSPAPATSAVPSTDPDELLNAALAVLVAPTYLRSRLDDFLRDHPQAREVSDFSARLDALVDEATSALWAEPRGVAWSEAFARDFIARRRDRHPWLSATGADALLAYARWLCWHEGLNR